MKNLRETLQAAAPKPDADYAQQLEEKLVAELAQLTAAANGGSHMIAESTLSKPHRPFIRRAFASPLMLAAAALVLIAAAWVFGPLRWSGNGHVALGPTQTSQIVYPTITPDNAENLRLVDTLGNGGVYQAAYSPDGETLALAGGLGIWLYDANDLSGGSRLLMTEQSATAVAYSPDGALIASGHANGEVRLWSATSGQRLKTLSGHSDRVNALTFSPDSKKLASASGSGDDETEDTLRLWDIDTGVQLWADRQTMYSAWSVSYSVDARALAVDTGDTITVRVDTPEGGTAFRIIERFQEEFTTPASTFLPFGTSLVLSEANTLHFYSFDFDAPDRPTLRDDGTVSVSLEEDSIVTAIASATDGSHVVAGTTSGGVYVVDVETRAVTTLQEADGGQVLSVAVSSGGQVTAAFNNGAVNLYDLDSGEAVTQIGDFDYAILEVAAVGENQLAAIAIGSTVRRWDVASGALLATFRPSADPITDSTVSPGGATLAYTWLDGSVATSSYVPNLIGVQIADMVLSPDGASLAFTRLDDGVPMSTYVHHLRDQSDVRIANSALQGATFSHDGRLIAGVGEQWSLYVADAETGVIQQLWGDYRQDFWFSPAFSPDDTRLAVGSPGMISIFDLESGELIESFPVTDESLTVSGLWYSPDGKTLLAKMQPSTSWVITDTYSVLELEQDDIQLLLLDAETGDLIHDLTLASPEDSPDLYRTSEATFSPGGALVAVMTSIQFGAMRLDLWDTATGERLNTPALDGVDVTTVDFNTDGNLLITGGWDGLIRLYGVTP